MMKQLILAGAALASVMAFCTTASAESLGEQGQIAILSDLKLDFAYKTHKRGDDALNFYIQPALDYFVIDNLSVGGVIGFSYEKLPWKEAMFKIGPRAGYVLGITDSFAFWPKLGFTFGIGSIKPVPDVDAGTHTLFTLDIYAPFTFAPVDNFFVGIGPNFSVDLINKAKIGDSSGDVNEKGIAFGLMSTIGGYF